ncbi:hypothetical protein HDV03_002298 [Kappamyces sp. JEL0829]|nr:hypothetical protein HDV03_002298 [Kappamyces sp. JEL0829]KAJ3327097.1 hypothetical protein HDU91_004479 [Kappamyces sp. JEL0680]
MRIFKFGPHPIKSTEQIFFNSKHSLGLVNLKPVVPGHVLVISKRVCLRFSQLTKDEVSDLFQAAHTISSQIERIHEADSMTLTIQDGVFAGQSVPHVHLHIIPRKQGDWMNNDDIYSAINSKERELGNTLECATASKGPDCDDRLPRTVPDMTRETEMLRELFIPHEDIWNA